MELKEISAVRTSGNIESGENWAEVTKASNIEIMDKKFSAQIKGRSITTFIIK